MIATRRPYGAAFPIVLILGGLVILLANLGTLPQDAGWRLLQLWPLILVMVGVQLLVPHLVPSAAVPALTLLLVGAIAAGAFAYALAGPSAGSGTYTRFESASEAAGLTTGTITVEGAGAQITITSRDLGTQLYQAKIDYAGSAPRLTYADGNIHVISGAGNNNIFNWNRRQDIVDLAVSRSVAWTINIDGAGTTTKVDLSQGDLRTLKINGVGGTVTVTAGAPNGIVGVSLSGVGTTLNLVVPAAVQYRVTAEGIGTSIAGTAQTPGWSTAQDRYDVSLNGVGARAVVTVEG